jgi:hypothetical protein
VAYVDIVIPRLNPTPFLFVAYTHGVEDGLICNGNAFVSTNNSHNFENSLFYSTACLVGKELAPDLINKRCRAFIGFKDESKVLFEDSSYRKVFMDCDNYALKKFMMSDTTIEEAFEAMKKYYTTKIDHYLSIKDLLVAGDLVENREALVCLGDKNLKKEDLFIS